MQSKALLTMSKRELDRLAVVERIIDRRMTSVDGGKQLGITARQMGRLVKAFKTGRPESYISKKRKKRMNRAYPKELKQQALQIVTDHYTNKESCSDLTSRKWNIEQDISKMLKAEHF